MAEQGKKDLLSGIKILDFTRYFPGPFGTLRLEDRGAEIIKIEEPNGDPARFMDTINGEEGCVFRSQSRGKKSIVLDLKDQEQHKKLLKLTCGVDVVIESFRPGVTQKLGIDYESLIKINPSLVYCSLSGYGQNTSISNLGGHDINYMALSGVLAQFRDSSGAPIKPYIAIADLVGGLAASEAILSGLVHKERTGKGTYLDISMTDVMLSFMGLHVSLQSVTEEEHGIYNHYIAYDVYQTKDNRYVALGAIEEKFWVNFCKGVNREDLIPGHYALPEPDNAYRKEIIKIFKSRTFKEWSEFALQVDCCLAPVLETSELQNSPYVRERGFIMNRWGMNYVATQYTGKPFLSSDMPYPKLGENNDLLI
jgi:alpha-methylacyl-CoA racemase